jgi:hypothetical protein
MRVWLHRCVYYKVPRERLAPACAAVRTVQRTWAAREPGLHAELLLRVDAAAASGPATVMEVWRWEPDPAAQPQAAPAWASLERELGLALGEALIGSRHVEDFGAAPG